MDLLKFPVGNRGVFAVVGEFNDYLMVHVRKYYKEKPTRYGAALSSKEWQQLLEKGNQINGLVEQMQRDLVEQQKQPKENRQDLKSELLPIGSRGYFVFVSEFKNTIKIHIVKFEDGTPTEKEVTLNPKEWQSLLAKSDEIDELIKKRKQELNREAFKKLYKFLRESAREIKYTPPMKKHCSEQDKM